MNLDQQQSIWLCQVNLNLPWWIWICRGEFELAVVNLNLPQRIWICPDEFKFDVVNLNLPWWIWNCRSEFDFGVVNLDLLLWIWICRGEFAVVNLNLPCWIWNCHSEFDFAVVNLNCHGEFKIYGQPTSVTTKLIYSRRNFKSFHNTLLFGAKFLIIWATHFSHCKTFFLAAKLSSLRQNLLIKAKLPLSFVANF